jgi:hypothetical protein
VLAAAGSAGGPVRARLGRRAASAKNAQATARLTEEAQDFRNLATRWARELNLPIPRKSSAP